jgi:phospholipase C
MIRRAFPASVLAAILCAAGCSGGAPAAPGMIPAAPDGAQTAIGSHIKHVIIIVQENRSFDNLFATYRGADGTRDGKTPHGTIKLRVANLASPKVPQYLYHNFLTDYDGGKMDGFINGSGIGRYVYEYVNPAQIKPYWALARQYVLADHMFQTQGSASFTAHQDLIAGGTVLNSTESVVDVPSQMPWGCDAPAGTTVPLLTTALQYVTPGVTPCFKYRTLRDTLDAKGISWKYYTPKLEGESFGGAIWDPFEAISAVRYGPEWTTNISSPETNVFADISGGKLPSVAWVIPDFNNSDHAGGRYDTGPSWVASVVNAVGKSQYWNSTAIVIVWDDWGGFYDHVPPPFLDKAGGLGFRVPMIVVSPFAKKGYVTHQQYEFGSIVKFVEDTFGLPRLGTTDVRAHDFATDVLNFAQAPRTFVPIPAKYDKAFFLRQKPSNLPVDTE